MVIIYIMLLIARMST